MAPTVTRSGRIVKMPARYLPEEPANKAAGKAARQSARQPPQRTGIRLHGVTINTIHAVHRRMLRARQAQLCAGLARMALGEETLDIVAEGFQDMDLDTVAEGSQDMDLDEPKVHIKQEPNESPIAPAWAFTWMPQEGTTPRLLVEHPSFAAVPQADVTARGVVKREDSWSTEEGVRILLMAAE